MSESSALAIRRAGRADAVLLAAVTCAAYAKFVDRIGRRPEPMKADYVEVVAKADVWLAMDGGLCAGSLVLMPATDHLLVWSVAVDPRHQGQGLGRRLMALAEAEARRQAIGEIRLYTNELMTENIVFYERLGYHETERRPHAEGGVLVYLSKPLGTGA